MMSRRECGVARVRAYAARATRCYDARRLFYAPARDASLYAAAVVDAVRVKSAPFIRDDVIDVRERVTFAIDDAA